MRIVVHLFTFYEIEILSFFNHERDKIFNTSIPTSYSRYTMIEMYT